ncbi:helix-turn-helix domain-containing protein (plasmid) [Streptomyces longwoodensis]|uniref:helix-turn-helix domain-containing protein n=1 Tax=Streptomyces longwoodensis TaxID=68231 RepID=UPI002F91B5B7|nr:helix-turn-helix domain-containing protein [Streptomyces longwoodensis]
MEKVYDSANFCAVDALDAWAAITADAVMPTGFQLVDTDTFDGCLKVASLGAVQVSAMAYHSFRCVRTPKLIRAADPECFQVAFMRSGRHVLEQDRNQAALRSGEIAIFDSSRPFETWADGESVLIQFPHTLLPLPAGRVRSMLARPFPGHKGIGCLLADFLTRIEEDGADYTPQDSIRLAAVSLDLVTAVIAHYLERDSEVPADSRQRALYLRVTSHIQRHLGDPALTVDSIAAAHHISVRSLHRLFQQHGVSVRAWIRAQRMEHSCRDLADPMRRHQAITAVAARWGFTRPADFSRAFRARYGITPSEYRDRACGDGMDSGPKRERPVPEARASRAPDRRG